MGWSCIGGLWVLLAVGGNMPIAIRGNYCPVFWEITVTRRKI